MDLLDLLEADFTGRFLSIPIRNLESSKFFERKHASCEGVMICPEAATCVDGLGQLVESGMVSADDRIVIFNTAAGQKYLSPQKLDLPALDIQAGIDWEKFEQEHLS